MIAGHDLIASLDGHPPMIIDSTTTEADEAASRATLGWMNDSSVGIQRYQGVPPWEIHCDADELLYVVDGDLELTVVGDDGPQTVRMTGGMIVVVPKARWHRPVAKPLVTLFSVTPFTSSDIAFTDDPPSS